MTRLLVIGASGLLGAEAMLAAVDRGFDVIGVSNDSAIRPPSGAAAVLADVAAPGTADDLLREVRPSWVINAAAAVDVDALEVEPDRAERLNAQLPAGLAAAAHIHGVRLVHLSTDAVFDGRSTRPYLEEDAPNPLNVYGASKLRGEQAVLSAAPSSLVVRTTIYGWNALAKTSLAEWFLAALAAGEHPAGYTDAWFSPINTAHLVEAVLDLVSRPAWPPATPGRVLHLAGGDCVSKYEFGRQVAAASGYDADLIRPGRLGDRRFIAPRARWACLDSTRGAAMLGRPAPSLDAGLARLLDDQASGRRAALKQLGGRG